MKNINREMRDKVTVNKFFHVHYAVFADLFRHYKKQSLLLLVISILTIFSNVVNLLMIEFITNSVSNHLLQGPTQYDTFIAIGCGLIFSLLFFQLLQNAFNILNQRYFDRVSADMEKNIVLKLSEIPYELFESHTLFEKINMAAQVSSQYNNVIYAISQIVQISITMIMYTVLLAKLHWLYILVALAAIIVSSILSAKTTDKQLDFWRKHVSPQQRLKEYFQGIYSNRINHACNQTNRTLSFFIRKYETHIKKERSKYLQLNSFSFFTEFLSSILFIFTFLVTILVSGRMVSEGKIEVGYFAMILAALVNMHNTIKQFIMFMLNSNWYVKVVDSYNEIMSIHRPPDYGGASVSMSDGILIRSLRYRYPQAEKYAINGVGQVFHFGEKIAIVGYNGSGKTTLMSIISDLLINYEGSVEKSNVSIMSIGQDFGQYQLTVRDNIQLGNGGVKISENEINDILVKIELKEVIDAFPGGIDTTLGQLGENVELSKGQWQRLAIARLLANSKANVWILDEPTAYLDPVAEIDMYKFILNLAGDRLVFFVSHRLGFAQFANRVLVLQEGKIVENGSHDELMKSQNSLYARMFAAQSEWYK